MLVRPLPRDLRIKSEAELNETQARVHEDLDHIRQWISQHAYLKAKTDDQWLLTFLRGCKFSLQRTKQKLEKFYSMRTLVPEYFANRDPFLPEIQEILKLGIILPLPAPEGCIEPRTILTRNANSNPSKVLLVNVIKTSIMILDILMNEDDGFVISGQQILADLNGLTLGHATQITPSICKKTIMCLQDAYPTRPKSFLVINAPSFVESIVNMVKPLFNEKLRKRIIVYSESNAKEVYNSVPLASLPKEYGGDGSTLEKLTVYWKQKVESYHDWFLQEKRYGIDEKMLSSKIRIYNEIFGMEGSFRKLDID